MSIDVVWIGHGLAFKVKGVVYLHRALREPGWQKLREILLEHECGHNDGVYSSKDFFHDLMDVKGLWLKTKFMLLHPSSWSSLSPVCKIRGVWTIDTTIVYCWFLTVIAGIIGAGIKQGFWGGA